MKNCSTRSSFAERLVFDVFFNRHEHAMALATEFEIQQSYRDPIVAEIEIQRSYRSRAAATDTYPVRYAA
jgi:hypothetical protein